MAKFQDLPTELIISIAEQMFPVDSFNFAIACKASWNACHSIIKQHQERFKRYGAIALTEGNRIWELVNKILDDPSIAHYIREAYMPAERGVFYDTEIWMGDQITAATRRPPAEDVARYTEAATSDPLLDRRLDDRQLESHLQWMGREVPSIGQAFDDGSDGPMINLFLSLLPSLKLLDYTAYGDEFWLLHYVKQVALAYADPTPALPFQNLKHLRIAHWDTEGHAEWQWIRYFICIPSLRTVCGHMIGSEEEGDEEEEEEEEEGANLRVRSHSSELPTSNVTDLRFTECALGMKALAGILGGISAVKAFKYRHNGATSYTPFHAKGLVKVLLKTTGHSLEDLAIEDDERTDESYGTPPFRVSLRGFQRLKTLRIYWDDLLPDENDIDGGHDDPLGEGFHSEQSIPDSAALSLLQILPQTLEGLHLFTDDIPGDSVQCAEELLRHIPKYLPDLKQLYVEGLGNDIPEEFGEKVEEAGLRFERLPEVYP